VNRLEVELEIQKKRLWMLEVYSALDEETLNRPCTQDEFDPTHWWTLKDHFSHCNHIVKTRALVVREYLSGAENPFLMMDGTRADFHNTPIPELMSQVNGNTHKVMREHHDKSFLEIVRVGQETLSFTLDVLASATDEQVEAKIPNAPWGDGSIGSILAGGDHERDHFRFAMAGMLKAAEANAVA